MKKHSTLFLFLFFLLQIQAQTLYFPPLTGNTWDTLSPNRFNWCTENIDSLYNYLEATHAKSFMILKDGKIVLEKYFGNFTQDSIHYWASAGKSLTATLIGIAQEKGLLNINDSVSKYLGVGWTSELPEKEKLISIKNVLSMTSGLDDNPAAPCNDLSQAPACLQYLADAGTRWGYHSGPYRKLEDIIELVTGKTYTQATADFIGNKIGMDGLWFNSVFYSNTRAMARFGLLMLNKVIWQNDTIMKDTSYFNAMTNTSQNLNKSYGYLWWLNGKSSYMLPTVQFIFPSMLIPTGPPDMFVAMGKGHQRIYVVPSQKMVVVRVGETPDNSLAWSPFDTIVWKYISKLDDACMTTSIHQNIKKIELKLFPNPANNYLFFDGFSSNETIHFRIINSLGRIVKEDETFNHSIDISDLEKGNYFISLQNKTEEAIKAFIKN
ncbi:MAG: serine hydrolase [Chitinophagales bacterium]|nr:serine hydrolase [Bacteroidota bacterium]